MLANSTLNSQRKATRCPTYRVSPPAIRLTRLYDTTGKTRLAKLVPVTDRQPYIYDAEGEPQEQYHYCPRAVAIYA